MNIIRNVIAVCSFFFLLFHNNAFGQGSWTQRTNLTGAARLYGVGFSIGSKGYIGTGRDAGNNALQDFWEWDQATDTWTQKADYGGGSTYGATGFSIGNYGYIGTGWTNGTWGQNFWQWDQSLNVWIKKTDFPGVGRIIATGFSIGSKGYIGIGNYFVAQSDYYEYDPQLDSWTPIASFGAGVRQGAMAFSIGSKGYVCTGYNSSGGIFNDLWEYDQVIGTWSQKANFGGSARNFAAGFSIGTKGYVGTGSYLNDFWEWDQAGNAWTPVADFAGAGRATAAGFSIGCKGYISTGEISSGGLLQDLWEFNPVSIVSLNVQNICGTDCNGSIGATVTGGIVPYSYQWNTSPFQNSSSATGLCQGIYSLTVSDSLGCRDTASAQILQYSSLDAQIISFTNATCAGGFTDGNATVQATGGSGFYSFEWNTSPQQASATATGLPIGSYVVTVTDSTGCIDTAEAVIAGPVEICDDGIDNDCDGFADTLDAFCNSCDSITQINFEDGQLPSAHDWIAGYSIYAAGNSSIVGGATGNAMQVSNTSSFGWHYKLEGLCLDKCDWSYEMDYKIVSNTGGSAGAGLVIGIRISKCVVASFNPTGGFHHYKIESKNGVITGSMDGNPYTVNISNSYAINNALYFIFGNIGQYASIEVDNISFFYCENSCVCVSVYEDTLFACDSAFYNGSWYNSSQTVTDTFLTTNGCSDSIAIMNIVIASSPFASFSVVDHCESDTAYFVNQSVLPGGIISAWQWDFADGDSSLLPEPEHIYDSAGSYMVSLIAISDSGCADTAEVMLNVYPAPVAAFSFFSSCASDSVFFTDSSSVSSGNISWEWDFGDGTASETSQNPVHVYSASDMYNIKLVVETDFGCVDSATKSIVFQSVPVAGFSFENECEGEAVTFSDSSKNTAFWQWIFGDNVSSSQQNPSHIYTGSGDFTVTQIVSSWGGCRDTLTDTITVFPKPVADFEPDTVCLNDSTQFKDISQISSGTINEWLWSFGDGGTSVLQNPYHYYSLDTYIVTLFVISDKGCKDEEVKLVGVHPLPIADFNLSNACLNEQPALFSDSSYISSGSIVQWQWNFGPGTSSASVPNPTYTYINAGTFPVELVVTSDNGCTDTVQEAVEIYPAPAANFTADTLTGCEPHCVDFSDISTIANGAIASLNWSFSNGNTSTLASPSTCFLNSGAYSVSLLVTSDKGCKDTLVKDNYITVYPLPVADFYFLPQPTTIQDMNIFFSDSSEGAVALWEWTFFDNDSGTIKSVSTQQHPSFNFASLPSNSFVFFTEDSGEYPVQLMVTTINGCMDSLIKKVKIDGVFYVNIPNAFTPEGNGINDFFFPSGIGFFPEKDFDFFIFDRWGSLIYESHSATMPWNGTFQGEPVQQDVYVWMIRLKDASHKEHTYLGHVTLIR